jgi:hypothetical protein
MSANTIARLKITLNAVKPVVLRRIEVPFDIRLDRPHLTIQAALGWTNPNNAPRGGFLRVDPAHARLQPSWWAGVMSLGVQRV